ncbi:MAG: hypothetical protein M1479_08530 [Actinobacteria bacterium]|nr:hypothetical protein [Actinomycetota bacterium]
MQGKFWPRNLKDITVIKVHSTTGEIPDERFYRAFDDKRSLFREFVIPSPFVLSKGYICSKR